MSGIHTFDDLKDRCFIDELTGCWHWRGARNTHGAPSMWLPALRRRVLLSTTICFLKTGEGPRDGMVWHCTCDTTSCANPEHRRCGDRSSQMLAAKMVRTPLMRARMSAARRAGSKLSDEAVQQIRESQDILSVEAEKHGISPSHVWKIRQNQSRKVLAAPGSSVFNFDPRAHARSEAA